MGLSLFWLVGTQAAKGKAGPPPGGPGPQGGGKVAVEIFAIQ